MTDSSLRYERSIFFRPALGKGPKGDLRVSPDSRLGSTQEPIIVVLADPRQVNWSDEDTNSDRSAEVGEITGLIYSDLQNLKPTEPAAQIELEIGDALLSSYRKANSRARALNIFASLLTAIWYKKTLYIASVGICKIFLIRNQSLEQLNKGDHFQLEQDNISYTFSNLFTNLIGIGTVESVNDLHFSVSIIEPDDLFLICNETFYEGVSGSELLKAKDRYYVDELTLSLGQGIIKNIDAFETVSLCALKLI